MYEVDILPVLCLIHQVLEIQDELYLHLTRQRKAFGAVPALRKEDSARKQWDLSWMNYHFIVS